MSYLSYGSNCTAALDPSYEDLLRNDSLVILSYCHGRCTIKNEVTGEEVIKDIYLDWTQTTQTDSFGVFCYKGRRGYYNLYTGRVAIPAQYRRAWVFSNGLAAVQRNGYIGFINHAGETVIDFKFPYHGNRLSSFVFKHGHCVVADTSGLCGIIDTHGNWVVSPEYDYVRAFSEYAIVSKEGVKVQMDYQGNVINSFVFDRIEPLTHRVAETYRDKDDDVHHVEKDVETGYYTYYAGGRCGLMDSKYRRLTLPLYSSINFLDNNVFRATLIDDFSEVLINNNGDVMVDLPERL